ncbi:oxidoreductase [Longispora fulva]|uniref:D-threo-aldose 1-dehydrogenase n=1 Tax=Longispora fulva TaxID=619741 RepID=A0A8J7KDK5_9ACTN|nr:aldo/keto reductase [Longispora fulva]MBG6134100.1 D-threo-aldose 1-dehydrogenase [Longispora fulva]GIG62473.1 oxidoreductase [Longispora fulva]
MHRNPLGRTNVEVTSLGFGAAPIGNLYREIDDETADAAVRAAWDGGVRYFDTAPHYGLGLSERRLGAALAGKPRAEYTISTKVGRLLVPNPAPTGSDLDSGGFAVPDDLTRVLDYTRDGVLRSLEASLQRLRTDRIDIVYVHDPDNHLDQAVAETIPALIELRDQGVIGAIGAGMNYVEPLLRIVTETDVDAVMLAGRWTLADRSGAPLLAACAERGVSVVAAAPFNSGLLANPNPADGAYFNYGPASPDVLGHARALAAVCDRHGVELPHAAMRFPGLHPAVASVVAGMRNSSQVEGNVRWATRALTEELWEDLASLDAERPTSLREA